MRPRLRPTLKAVIGLSEATGKREVIAPVCMQNTEAQPTISNAQNNDTHLLGGVPQRLVSQPGGRYIVPARQKAGLWWGLRAAHRPVLRLGLWLGLCGWGGLWGVGGATALPMVRHLYTLLRLKRACAGSVG